MKDNTHGRTPEDGVPAVENAYSRRSLLKGFGAGAVGAATLPGLAGATLLAPSAAAAPTAWAKAPVTFVFVNSQDPDHLDPAFGTEFDEFDVHRNVFEPLVDTDEANAKLIPALATKWSSSPDATVHTFTLRPGVKFHDGSKLDAAAVKLNLDRYIAIGQGESYLIKNIAKVAVAGPMTVKITTKAADPWLPAHLVKFGMVSAKSITDHKTGSDPWAKKYVGTNPIGTGPYKFQSWQKGTRITLVKNTAWWGTWGPGSIDKLIIQPVPDASTRVQLIKRGSADFCTEWAIKDALDVAKSSGFMLRKFKTFDTNPMINFNCLQAPFDKKEVRQAFQYAFDYKAMKDFFQGQAADQTGPLPADYPGGAKDLPAFKQDINKAKALLAKAGVSPSDLQPTFMTPTGYADLNAGATITQASLAQIGVNVKIQTIPFGQIVSAFAKEDTSPSMTDLYNSPFTLDPTQFLINSVPGNFSNSLGHYSNPQVTKMINEIAATQNASKRTTLLHDVQHLIRDDAPQIWGGRPLTLVAHRDYVTGYQMQFTDYRFPVRFAQLRIKAH